MSWPVLTLPCPDFGWAAGRSWPVWRTPEGAAAVRHSAAVQRAPRVADLTWPMLTNAQADYLESEWHRTGRGAEPRTITLPDGSATFDALFESLTFERQQDGLRRTRVAARFVEAL